MHGRCNILVIGEFIIVTSKIIKGLYSSGKFLSLGFCKFSQVIFGFVRSPIGYLLTSSFNHNFWFYVSFYEMAF